MSPLHDGSDTAQSGQSAASWSTTCSRWKAQTQSTRGSVVYVFMDLGHVKMLSSCCLMKNVSVQKATGWCNTKVQAVSKYRQNRAPGRLRR